MKHKEKKLQTIQLVALGEYTANLKNRQMFIKLNQLVILAVKTVTIKMKKAMKKLNIRIHKNNELMGYNITLRIFSR